MQKTATSVLAFFLLEALTVSPAWAQDSEPEATGGESGSELASDGAPTAPYPIEEITVVGQRSLARLKLRIEEKEQEIYAFFNDNNSHDRFDIICIKRRPTGTHILQRECEPRFLRQLRVENTRDLRMGIGVPYNQRELVELSAQHFEQLQNEMLEMMSKNEAFARNLADLADLTENLEAHRRAMFGIED